jgi:hypothetical protein
VKQFCLNFAYLPDINPQTMNTKTVFLLVCLLLPATLLLQAQDNPVPRDSETGKIKFQEVVEEPGTQEELFNRSINWLNNYYRDPVRVTSVRDKATGKIIGKHTIRITQGLEDGTVKEVAFVFYEFTIEVREGRYRYTISDLLLKTASRFEIERWLNTEDPKYDPLWATYIQQISDYADQWSANLKEKMKPGPEKKEDIW